MYLLSLRLLRLISLSYFAWAVLFLHLVYGNFTHASNFTYASKPPAHAPKSFDGFYIGIQGDLVNSKVKSSIKDDTIIKVVDGIPGVVTSGSKNTKGFIFKALAGYGKEINNFYLGAEISIGVDITSREVIAFILDSNLSRYTEKTIYKRGIIFGFSPKFGYIFDKNLIYFRIGVELSPDKVNITPSITANGVTSQSSLEKVTKETKISFAPSVGYETAIEKFLLRLEYTYNVGSSIENKKPNSLLFAKTCYYDNRFSIGLSYKL
ncbi:MAG: hypothetical protein Q8S21_03765 [Candidatus Paracaedibacteraceae bacterium]|nr:hypothetical protein [Candidatus Paracaedibacteraceae bacterium]